MLVNIMVWWLVGQAVQLGILLIKEWVTKKSQIQEMAECCKGISLLTIIIWSIPISMIWPAGVVLNIIDIATALSKRNRA